MFGNSRWAAAAMAAGLIALAALTGCGGDKSVASKNAGGEGHEHGHGAPTPSGAHGGEHKGHEMPDAGPGENAAEHQHGTAHAGHEVPEGGSSADHTAMGHGGQHATAGHDHGAMQPAAPGQGHGGHSAPGGGMPSAPAPELPTQPAGILRPDPLDAPAATSVADAQRSAEMNQAMGGGHGGHGAVTYRHVDAGRGPEAHEGPEHHDHGAALYVCPMHPEVTSKAPGTCPKCGMALAERREE